MLKKTLSIILTLTMLFTTLVVGNVVFAETIGNGTDDSQGFKAGDTVYFDCSVCGGVWTSSNAVEYINFTENTKEENGGSVVIAECDKTKYNPVVVTDMITSYVFSYTFTEKTAGATALRFWRGNSEKLWNNSPLLTYEDYQSGKNLIKADNLEGDGSIGTYSASAPIFDEGLKLSYGKVNNLYAHGVSGKEDDTEAWQCWQHKRNTESGLFTSSGTYYFFLPSSASETSVDIYNTFNTDVTVGSVTIPANSTVTMAYTPNTTYDVTADGATYQLKIMRSSAECAVYVNNSVPFEGMDLYTYLCQQKSNYAKATGAVTDRDGNIENTSIKKIKGRGNTSWDKPKKSFNITFDSAVEIAGMEKSKKYSICANFQDDTLTRNRLLYDLGDQVGLPYSPDSRYSDFYINGDYMGSYQMCEKVEVGSGYLINDITGEEYLNSDGTLAKDFAFAFKVDSGIDYDDFYFRAGDNNLIVIAPELTSADKYYNEVKTYISEKFTEMYNALKNDSPNLTDYIDKDSCAKIFLINELGKNWDAGVGSFYFVYKPDENGKYKFYASPTWDYDNSLGNAVGVSGDLNRMGVTDYEEPTGLFVTYKGGRKSTTNVASLMYRNTELKKRIGEVWYESFVPAIENILKKTNITTGELYSADTYYNLVKKSAEMNYESGWLMYSVPGWLASHNSLNKCSFDYTAKTYSQSTTATKYDDTTFKGIYDYMIDWATSRSAWLSNLFIDSYISPDQPTTKPTTPSVTQPVKEHEIGENTLVEFYFDNTNKIAEDKLTEYGDKAGYKATFGQATLKASVDGENDRALEWSVAEYGEDGNQMVPLMTAGSKNPWGENPYIEVNLDASCYSDLAFSFEIAGSKKAPASWSLWYSLDGANFKKIDNTDFTISLDNRKILTSYLGNVTLPQECNGAGNLTIRISANSTTTVSGGTTADDPTGGEVAINNIVLEGKSTKTALPGDANLDGVLTVQDAVTIQKSNVHILKLNSLQTKAADFNGDGNVNIKDITAIQKAVAQLV
ncbi:MAG: CotH kinase family protein [Ruminococcus sp.]